MRFAPEGAVLTLLAMVVAGCSADSYVGSRAIVVHGKFAHLNCTQIEANIKSTQSRIAEINGLIRKASQEAGGSAIATVVYGAPLADAEATLRIYREAQIEKKCLADVSVSQPPH